MWAFRLPTTGTSWTFWYSGNGSYAVALDPPQASTNPAATAAMITALAVALILIRCLPHLRRFDDSKTRKLAKFRQR
jgi:hypothetical protein